MLWSLIKIILFIAVIAALTLAAGSLLEMGGGMRVAIGGLEFNLGPLQTIVALVLLVVAVWLVLKLLGLLVAVLRFLNGDETSLSRWFTRNRERKGYDALADGMLALASGEGRTAMSKAATAERYLGRPELTNLITAQAAEVSGDRAKAEEVYKRLLHDDRTRFVGIRGIMKQKLAEGDTDTAMRLAERAFALKPRHEETQDVLLRLQADKGDWAGARQTLGAKLKYGALPRNVYRRRDAVLALGEARAVIEDGNSIEARETAIQANKLSPDLVPAAVMAAKSYIEQGQKKYATRVLAKTWAAQPHPDLAAAFAAIEPEETSEARLKRFNALLRQQPDHPETKMLLAELHIAAGQFPEARRAIGDLPDSHPTARGLTIMAAIERGMGASDAVVRAYLARAVAAPRGPQWVCENCHNIPAAWTPVCPNCGAFDTLAWTTPDKGRDTLPGGDAMLPLIVGEPERAEVIADDRGDRKAVAAAQEAEDAEEIRTEQVPSGPLDPDLPGVPPPPPGAADRRVLIDGDPLEGTRK